MAMSISSAGQRLVSIPYRWLEHFVFAMSSKVGAQLQFLWIMSIIDKQLLLFASGKRWLRNKMHWLILRSSAAKARVFTRFIDDMKANRWQKSYKPTKG